MEQLILLFDLETKENICLKYRTSDNFIMWRQCLSAKPSLAIHVCIQWKY